MKRLAWSEVRSARQPGLKQELRVLIELLRVLPRPELPTQLTILPSNIMVGDDGSVLIGAARLEGVSQQERYLAPEVQCGAEPMLPAAIYAVGALLFEAVTGHRFETREHVTQELAGARAMARAAGLGARFWEIYLLEAASKATEEQPEARWVSGSDFAEDLERVARDRIVTRAELGGLVAEVLEGRSSHPPTRTSGVPEVKGRSGPPPLPKRTRRRTSSQRHKAVTAPASAQRPAPIPRSDGDPPQMPLITALRVPARLKLPEVAAVPASAFDETEPPTLLRTSGPSPAPAPTPAPVPVAEASQPVTSTAQASGVRNPVKLGPRIEPEPGHARDLTPSVAPVVVPSLAAPPLTDPAPGGESRHRTLTGTGDLREFEQQFAASIAAQAGRHGTLLGLGDATLSENREPAREPPRSSNPPQSQRQSSGPPSSGTGANSWRVPGYGRGSDSGRSSDSGRGSDAGRGSDSGRASSSGAPGSSRPPSSTRTTSTSPPSFVYSPALDSGWDAAVPPVDDGSAHTDSSIPPYPAKKSWMGKALLMVVVLVALGIGTIEVYGHFVTPPLASGAKDAEEAVPKPKLDSKARPDSEGEHAEPSPVAARDSSPAEHEPSAATAPADMDSAAAAAKDTGQPPPEVLPASPPADPPRAQAAPKRPAPARPVAPPAPRPKPAAQRDYGI